ncbi:hypothetical protein thsps21_11100 [Pseudomonas sp. No.21]|uniref:hypothetical protein n=1 Tax=Pseudomonas tohonis TaxID=2725477 RepID=UPI001F379B8C|nr:hypothetical protein [Pseudomonas tohonis]GJN50151.1 hypothetical protein TUM20249_61370 [Pseudomonas tohonis]
MSVVAVQVCTKWHNGLLGTYCIQQEWRQAYLIPPEAAGYVDILVSGGFSPEAFGVGFAGTLGVFLTGLAVGWIASVLRKAK